jgi:hypothetical protein
MEGLLHYNLDAMWLFFAMCLLVASPDVIDYIVDKVQGWFDDKK